MARIRTIKPEFFQDPDVADCSPHARLAFIGLWCQADRAGRLKDEPRRLKGVLFPYEAVDMESLLGELVRARFVLRYETPEGRFLQVRTFGKHQIPHHREGASTLPAPDQSCLSPRPALDQPSASPGQGPVGREGKGMDQGKGRERNAREDGPAEGVVDDVWQSWREAAAAQGQEIRLGARLTETQHCLTLLHGYSVAELRPLMAAWWASPHTGGRNLGLFVAQVAEVHAHVTAGAPTAFRAPPSKADVVLDANIAVLQDWVKHG